MFKVYWAGLQSTPGQLWIVVNPPGQSARMQSDLYQPEESEDSEADVLLALRRASVSWACGSMRRWELDVDSRARRPSAILGQRDHLALQVRREQEKRSASQSRSAIGHEEVNDPIGGDGQGVDVSWPLHGSGVWSGEQASASASADTLNCVPNVESATVSAAAAWPARSIGVSSALSEAVTEGAGQSASTALASMPSNGVASAEGPSKRAEQDLCFSELASPAELLTNALE